MSDDAPAADPLAEQTLESSLVYEGAFLRIYRDRVRCPDGHVGVREFVRHPGAVMIAALLDDGRVVLERQFRYPLARSFVELPAGKIDPGETPLACARRELLEETGYRAGRWRHLGGFHNAVGYSDEKIEVFLARDLVFEGGATDAGEVIEVFTAPWRDLLDWVRTGTVTDVKTIVGAHWLERVLSGAWPLPAD
jgi:ADP-ribose pyrophosphatase